MFEIEMVGRDAAQTLAAAAEAHVTAERAAVRVLQCAGHWADLHGVVEAVAGRPALPGTQRLVQLGGDGTPKVAEFAPAELGAELGMSDFAAERLVADALDLRHRLPRLWARVLAGEIQQWVARRVAEATRDLPFEIAALIDRRVAPWAHSLSWGRLEGIVDAARRPHRGRPRRRATHREHGIASAGSVGRLVERPWHQRHSHPLRGAERDLVRRGDRPHRRRPGNPR